MLKPFVFFRFKNGLLEQLWGNLEVPLTDPFVQPSVDYWPSNHMYPDAKFEWRQVPSVTT